MPYFYFEDATEINNFIGITLTIGWIKDLNTFQIALTLGNYTIAFGINFDF